MAERIRRHRVDRGLTQEQLAQALSTSRFRVIAWERGNGPDDFYAGKLSEFFGTPDGEFVKPRRPGVEEAIAVYEKLGALIERGEALVANLERLVREGRRPGAS